MEDSRSWRFAVIAGICLVFCMILVVMQEPAAAQADPDEELEAIETPGTGIGAQLGVPTGITVRLHRSNRLSYEFMAAFDLSDSFFLDASGLFSFGINDMGWAYYLGPGAFVSFSDEGGQENITLGLSARAGISYYYSAFEFFGQITPRFELINESDEAFGGGVGVRIYF